MAEKRGEEVKELKEKSGFWGIGQGNIPCANLKGVKELGVQILYWREILFPFSSNTCHENFAEGKEEDKAEFYTKQIN